MNKIFFFVWLAIRLAIHNEFYHLVDISAFNKTNKNITCIFFISFIYNTRSIEDVELAPEDARMVPRPELLKTNSVSASFHYFSEPGIRVDS